MKAGQREIKVVKISSKEYQDIQEALVLLDNLLNCLYDTFNCNYTLNDIPELVDDAFSIYIEDE